LRRFLLHLPLIGALGVFGFIALVDAGYLETFRTESTFGWMLLVWYPLAILLVLLQAGIWIRLLVVHGIPSRRVSGRTRRAGFVGLLLLATVIVILIAFRAAQRWGLLE
jgi:hypothetical protein